MSNLCENILIIQGDNQTMNKFKELVNKEFINNFRMDFLCPTPIELIGVTTEDILQKNRLEIEKMKSSNIYLVDEILDGLNELDENNLNDKGLSLLNRFGYSTESLWRDNNWGTTSDMLDIKIISEEGNKLIVYYYTHWTPNNQFIKFLSEKLQDVQFQLLYNEPNSGYAGNYFIKNGIEDFEELPLNPVFCCTNNGESYLISDSDDVADSFESSYLINIVGGYYREALFIWGYTSENVINWDEVVSFFEES